MRPVVTGPGNGEPPPRPLLRTMLGDVLRRTRREQGRTLADVARAAKVSLPYLSELERGRKEGSSEVLAAVCDALGIELSELLVQAGHELFRETARRAQVIRLDAIRSHRAGPPAGQGSGHVPAAPTMLAA
jgi:transcriptional regulator with XRE-family HTH domain